MSFRLSQQNHRNYENTFTILQDGANKYCEDIQVTECNFFFFYQNDALLLHDTRQQVRVSYKQYCTIDNIQGNVFDSEYLLPSHVHLYSNFAAPCNADSSTYPLRGSLCVLVAISPGQCGNQPGLHLLLKYADIPIQCH